MAVCLLPAAAWAKEWHVSGAGDDAHDGASSARAFRTLKHAATVARPGDTVWVGDGLYTDEDSGHGSSILAISEHGSPEAWMTWKAAPGARPELRPTKGWHGILITGSYVIIDGLRVTGANDSLTLIDAIKDGTTKEKDGKAYSGSPRYNTNGITTDGRKSPITAKPHHVIVRNCVVSKMPGGGITFLEADHFTVEDNQVFDNCWYMRYAGSGVTTLNNWAADDAPGYHVIIRRNLVWNNKTLVPWSAIGKLSDGNGILLDVTDKKASGGAANPTGITAAIDPNAASLNPDRPEWKYRALIENNVSAYNGGSGIHTFRTAHVDIVNNTTYWNGSVVGYQELFPNRSDDIVFLNNIAVARPGAQVTSDNRNTNIRWEHNLISTAQ
ncbi:MAG: right-handed parallel beta-helix repeat-containing protein, partial [Burkholderiales bacterium]|nr:right-handed parallel beta-helix repeat-containing protein [Opitutaceae bacterium]